MVRVRQVGQAVRDGACEFRGVGCGCGHGDFF
jgi:hypothetical protein